MSTHHYDGVSEIMCQSPKCDYRIGRFCEAQLTAGQVEPPHCKGGYHPMIVQVLDDVNGSGFPNG